MSIVQQEMANKLRLQLQGRWLKYFQEVKSRGEAFRQKQTFNLPNSSNQAVLREIASFVDRLDNTLNSFVDVTDEQRRDALRKEKIQKDYESLVKLYEKAKDNGILKRDDNALNDALKRKPELYRYIRKNIALEKDSKLLNDTQNILNDNNTSNDEKELALELYRESLAQYPSRIQETNILTKKEASELLKKLQNDFTSVVTRYLQFTGERSLPEELQDDAGELAQDLLETEQKSLTNWLSADADVLESKVSEFSKKLLSNLNNSSRMQNMSARRNRQAQPAQEDDTFISYGEPMINLNYPIASAVASDGAESVARVSFPRMIEVEDAPITRQSSPVRIGDIESIQLNNSESLQRRQRLLKKFQEIQNDIPANEAQHTAQEIKNVVEDLARTEKASLLPSSRTERKTALQNEENLNARLLKFQQQLTGQKLGQRQKVKAKASSEKTVVATKASNLFNDDDEEEEKRQESDKKQQKYEKEEEQGNLPRGITSKKRKK